jgi:pimeloyl-ACP methyl ester carboxylesterase
LTRELALDLARSGMKQNDEGKWVWKFDPLHRTLSPQPFYSAQAVEFFRRIQCPVLIVDGKHSRHSQRPDKQQRLAVVRNKRFVEIDDAGHMIHLDNPQGLAEQVAGFLYSQAPRGAITEQTKLAIDLKRVKKEQQKQPQSGGAKN